MTVDEMLHRMYQVIPNAEFRDLVFEVNASVDRIANLRNWHWMETTDTIDLIAEYNTGTVAVVNGSASITGTSTVWTSLMTGRKIKFNNEAVDYTFTYVSGTTGTLDRVYSGDSDTEADYKIYQDVYSLPSNFKHYLSLVDLDFNVSLREYTKGMFIEQGYGFTPRIVTALPISQYGFWFYGKDSDNNMRIQILNQPTSANTLELSYWKRPTAIVDVADEPDLPDWLHESVYLHVLGKYVRRAKPEDKQEIQQTKQDFAEEIGSAVAVDARIARPETRNRPRFLRL